MTQLPQAFWIVTPNTVRSQQSGRHCTTPLPPARPSAARPPARPPTHVFDTRWAAVARCSPSSGWSTRCGRGPLERGFFFLKKGVGGTLSRSDFFLRCCPFGIQSQPSPVVVDMLRNNPLRPPKKFRARPGPTSYGAARGPSCASTGHFFLKKKTTAGPNRRRPITRRIFYLQST